MRRKGANFDCIRPQSAWRSARLVGSQQYDSFESAACSSRRWPRSQSGEGSLSVGEMFFHTHYVRLVFVSRDALELAKKLTGQERCVEPDRARMAALLNESGKALHNAVKRRKDGRMQAARWIFTTTPDSLSPAYDLA